ncbi:hypothetical protein LEP1GSC125_0340 [Leptospira mayottensis 200901122]|uniref:Uncharacterized protein n=1 Tax=Leptospira mayottensis 200901122 TaxID=1193010 RepID=A0AA87MM93_9LEPT|nr:hypothetical protein LEP1GSC125_0340 [Leptospira mayottensis 200901122]
MNKELSGSKKIALSEYQKLDRKKRVEIFNQLEMSNRFELLKTILLNGGAECRIGANDGAIFESSGKLSILSSEETFVNRWKIDSKGLTVYNVKKLEKLEDYLGKTHVTFDKVYWETFQVKSTSTYDSYSLTFEQEESMKNSEIYGYGIMLGCDP